MPRPDRPFSDLQDEFSFNFAVNEAVLYYSRQKPHYDPDQYQTGDSRLYGTLAALRYIDSARRSIEKSPKWGWGLFWDQYNVMKRRLPMHVLNVKKLDRETVRTEIAMRMLAD